MKTIIFAGGVGTRLWPLSRKKSPKQFEKIVDSKSTLQLAAGRLQPDFPWETMYVSTGAPYASIIASQLPKLPKDHIIGEPQVRDVGPAVGLMTAILYSQDPLEPMVILWSDHLVKKEALFRRLLKTSETLIKEKPDRIIFIGQKPRFASVNLGWIEYGKKAVEREKTTFYTFVDFQYRPDAPVAKKYFQSGHHAWNVGYFVTTPRFLWHQYKKHNPNLTSGLSEIAKDWKTPRFQKTIARIYPTLEKISFDNAILEKLDPKDALVVSEDIQWSDIGAWEALKEALEESHDHNVTQGKVLLTDTKDSLVFNYNGKQLVATIDVNDMLVVTTGDVVLVCPKTSVAKIKKLVESLSGSELDHLT